MNTTGRVKRDIYKQTGTFSFSVDVDIPDYSSVVKFGISGSGQSPHIFTYQNSKIYDYDGKFIGAYSANNTSTLSGNFTQNRYDVYIDGDLKILGNSKTSFSTDSFIFSGNSTGVTWNFYLNGDSPNIGTSDLLTFGTGDSSFIGFLKNSGNFNARIYSGQFLGNSGAFNLNIPAATIPSGGIVTYTGYPLSSDSAGFNNLQVLLYTNFGEVTIDIPVSGEVDNETPFSLDLNGPSFVPVGYPQIYVSTFNASTGVMPLSIGLYNLSGSGTSYIDIPISGYFESVLNGLITGCGILTSSLLSGSGTGIGGTLGNTGTSLVSGYLTQTICPTGNISFNPTIRFSGQGTGIGYTGDAYQDIQIPITTSFSQSDNGVKTIQYNSTGIYLNNPVYSSGPTIRVASTGYIDYNSPVSGMTNDILYVRNIYHGIVYGFDYTSQTELASYLNANTGLHGVNAIYTGGNRIYLNSVIGLEDSPIILQVDPDNSGSMSVSSPYLSGGYLSGFNSPISGINSGNWFSNQTLSLTGTGFFSISGNGYLTGSATVVDVIKPFTGLWSLASGSDGFNYTPITNFNSTHGYSSNTISEPFGNIYIQVSYNTTYANVGDVVQLWVSGSGVAQGEYQSLIITGGIA